MPHSSTATVTKATTTTKAYQYNSIVSPTLTEKEAGYLVRTPPPSSASPVELAPIILDICDSVVSVDNRPPSPDSPRLSKLVHSSHHHSHHHHLVSHLDDKRFSISQQPPPAYLEPTPQFNEPKTQLFPLNLLFNSIKQQQIPTIQATPAKLQIPIPRRRANTISTTTKSATATTTRHIISSRRPPSPINTTAKPTEEEDDDEKGPISPIMAAASASAAAAADHRHPGSHVAKSLLKSISSNSSSSPNDLLSTTYQPVVSTTKKQQQITSNNNVDQSMFLTKNAHIKRPRNAWIHFRCHYGQALKAQDPTLRAEEISKRASRRWGKLSENEKRPWHGLAEQEKLAHREAFPEYRYCPRRATVSAAASTNASSSPPLPQAQLPQPVVPTVINRVRSNTDYDYNSFRPQKRVKRNSK